jgi:acyl carrier protein
MSTTIDATTATATTMQQVLALIEQALGQAAGSLDDSAALDLTAGWDSLKTMELVLAVEQHFATTFSARQMMALDSAQALCAALRANGAG